MPETQYNFEEYDGKSKQAEQPFITILSNGDRMNFNHATFDLLGQPGAVKLLFDKRNVAIGLRAASDEEQHTYQIVKQPRAASYYVSARGFIRYYEIDHKVSRRYPVKMVGDVLVVELRGAFEEVGLTNSKPKTAGEMLMDSAKLLLTSVQRTQNLNVMNEARSFQQLIEEHQMTQEEIARQTGIQQSAVAERLFLLKLPMEVQELIEDGKLSLGHAVALRKLTPEQTIILATRSINEGWSTMRMREAANQLKGVNEND